MMFGSSLHQFVLLEFHVLLMLFVFIYVYWCKSRVQYCSCGLKSNMTGVICGAGISNLSGTPDLNSRFLVVFVSLDL